jgi:O-methyltransferase
MSLFPEAFETEEQFCNFFTALLTEHGTHFHHSVFWGDRLLTLDKFCGFMENPKFKEAYAQIHGAHLYDLYNTPHTIAWRLHTLCWAAQCGQNLPGDFVECGVFKGDMSWFITQNIPLQDHGKTFYLYDTFEGFSEKYSSYKDFDLNESCFAFADSVYKDKSIYPYVMNRFQDMPYVRVTKGVVPDCFQESPPPEKIAFLHIDLNSARAEVAAL